jgi:hypothetical protein
MINYELFVVRSVTDQNGQDFYNFSRRKIRWRVVQKNPTDENLQGFNRLSTPRNKEMCAGQYLLILYSDALRRSGVETTNLSLLELRTSSTI